MESFVTQNVMHASLCQMTSGIFQGEYSAMFIASRTYLWEKEGFCTLLNSLERTLAVLFDSALLVHLSLV